MTSSTTLEEVKDAVIKRSVAIDMARDARREALLDADRAFVDRIRPMIDAGEVSVSEVAAIAELDRTRVYQIMRQHPAATAAP